MREKAEARLGEVLRFALTGGVCFLVEFAALVLLRDGLGLDTLAAVPIAFALSVVFNYVLCMRFVFRGARDGGSAAKAGFAVTSVMGLVLNEGLMLLFRLLLGEDTVLLTLLGYPVTMYMLNKAMATLLVMVWNYLTKRAVLQSGVLQRLLHRP